MITSFSRLTVPAPGFLPDVGRALEGKETSLVEAEAIPLRLTGTGAWLGRLMASCPPLTGTLEMAREAECWPGAAGLKVSPSLTDWPGFRSPEDWAMEKKEGSMTALHCTRLGLVLERMSEELADKPGWVAGKETALLLTEIWDRED